MVGSILSDILLVGIGDDRPRDRHGRLTTIPTDFRLLPRYRLLQPARPRIQQCTRQDAIVLDDDHRGHHAPSNRPVLLFSSE